MDVLSMITPFIGVILGFGLAQFGEFFKDRKENKKTLKKLLFNLLELYHVLHQELNFENSMNNFLKRLMEKIPEENLKEIQNELHKLVAVIRENFMNTLIDTERASALEKNIDSIIVELAEVYPLFAYELSGQYKIKERLKKSEDYFNQFEEISGEETFVELKDWITPKITSNLINQLKEYIFAIAKSINRRTHKEITESNMLDFDENENPDLEEFLDEFLEKFKPTTEL